MLDIADDGRLQVSAGLALLETSELVIWDCDAERFDSVTFNEFECALKYFHQVFGRVICWIVFSAGAEFLAKGVCLLSDAERNETHIRTQDCVPAYPTPDVATWLETFKPGSPGTLPTTNFGQIGNLYNGHLQSLCNTLNAPIPKKKRLIAAYELLGRTIRNRDAHAYVPRVRAEHFDLVSQLFIPSLNDLLSWAPLPTGELNKWRREAQEFIDSLDLTGNHSDASTCNEAATLKKNRKQKMKRIEGILKTLAEDDLDKVISFSDKLGASNSEC